MPTGQRVRYTLNAVIPRDDWQEPIDGLNDLRKVSSIELVLAKIVPFDTSVSSSSSDISMAGSFSL